ncbi:MAG: hypothetical protein IJ853_03130 [Rickettsiales bacterium]|nr:hypothetical protein [Rickettsiales bacterium]
MDKFENMILKLMDLLPAWYIMFILTLLVFYYIINNMCESNSLLLIKQLTKWRQRDLKRNKKIDERLDNIENMIKQNSVDIEKIKNVA